MNEILYPLAFIYVVGLAIGVLIGIIDKPASPDESLGRAILWPLIVLAFILRGLVKTLVYIWRTMWGD